MIGKCFLSLLLAVNVLCLTSCSAAEVPVSGSGVNLDGASLTSEVRPASVFSDVPTDAWYAGAVNYCQQNGIMNGTSGATFAPEAAMTRAMLATALHRMSGAPESVSDTVSLSDWAQAAVCWANANDILDGMMENRRFDPKANIKRGEVASMLYHYLTSDMERSERAITVSVGEHHFEAVLYDTPAAEALWEMLPVTVTMRELNGNEKYHYMDTSLPAAAVSPGNIAAGDLMLYGDTCLVLFYESFPSSYSYTPLGKLSNPEGLVQAVGSGSVTVTFTRTSESAG